MKNAQAFRYFNNTGGLNNAVEPHLIADNEASDLLNVDFTKYGIHKRNGYIKYNSTAITGTPAITGLYEYIKKDSTSYFVCTAGADIWKDVNKTWTSIKTGLTSGANYYPTFETMIDSSGNDYCIIFNGQDQPQKWDGTTESNLTSDDSAPHAYYCKEFHRRLVAFNTTTYPGRVWWSPLDDPSGSWSATDFHDLCKLGTGLAVLGDNLYAFEEETIYRISYTYNPDTPFYFTKAVEGIGCVSHWSIQNIGTHLIFLTKQGLATFDGTNVKIVSQKIDTTIRDQNQNRIKYAQSALWKKWRRYLLSTIMGESTTHNKIIVWDYVRNAFSQYDIVANSIVCINERTDQVWDNVNETWDELADWTWHDFQTNQPALYFGDYGGFVYQGDYGTDDDGSAIDGYYCTKWFDMGVPEHVKLVKQLQLFLKKEGAMNIQVQYQTDFSPTWSTAVNFSMDGTEDYLSPKKWLSTTGRYIRFRFRNANANEPFTIPGFVILANIKGRR